MARAGPFAVALAIRVSPGALGRYVSSSAPDASAGASAMPRIAPKPHDPPGDQRIALDVAALSPTIDLMVDAVLVYDVRDNMPGRFIAANDAAVARYGYSLEELLALDASQVVVGRGIRDADVLARLRRDGRATVDAVHQVRDGRVVEVEASLRMLEIGGVDAVMSVSRDLSERRRAETALRESEERLRAAVSAAPLVLTRVGLDLRYEWAFDPRPGEPRVRPGAAAGEQLPPADRTRYRAILERAIETGVVVRETLGLTTGEGRREYQLTVTPVRSDSGAVVGATVAAYDTTDLRRTEAALQASEERLRLAQRAARIGTWEADPLTGRATWSEGMWELVGAEPRSDPDRELWRSLIHPDDLERAAESYDRALASGDTFEEEYRLVRPGDRSTIWVASRGRVIRDAVGTAVRVLGVNFDITDRRATEEALRASEERSAMAQRAAGVGTWEIDIASGDVLWSDGLWELTGLAPGAVSPTFDAWIALVHPDDREGLMAGFTDALREGDEWSDDFRLIRPSSGNAVWVTARGRVVRDADRRAVRVVGVTADITDRREAETAVRAGAAELRRFADAMPQLAYIAEGPVGEWPLPVYYNEQWYEYTGMPRTDDIETNWGGYLHHDDRAPARDELLRASSTGTPFELEYRFKGRNGEYRWFLGRSVPVTDERGELVRWFGTCTDIHDLKAAEAALAEANSRLEDRVARRTAALRASEALLGGVLQTSLDAVTVGESVRDDDGVIRDFRWRLVNPAAATMFGLSVEDMEGKVPDEVGVPFRDTDLFLLHREVVETGNPVRHRFNFKREGYDAWVDLISVKLADGYAATFRDVTAQVDAEEALRESETRFRLLVEGVVDYAIFLLDADGRVISWNAGAERMKGHTAEEVLGRHMAMFYPPEEADAARQELELAARTGRAESGGWRARRDGSPFWASTILTAIRDDEGRLTGFARLTRDDTERRESEQALRASEERFRSLFSSTPMGVAVVGTDGRLTDANPALLVLLGRTAEETIGMSLLDLTHPTDRRLVAPLFDDLVSRRRASFQIEGRYAGADAAVWAQTTAIAVPGPDGATHYVVASVADVTERRELEQAAIEAAEAERRRLSYELHDDLAQRLAGASVLSHTLAEQLRDDEHAGAAAAVRLGDLVRDAMAHARALSRALAPVDLLSEGLAEALERLSASTEQAYGVTCTCTVSATANVANPALATHLFRIAQEAISNAARHAGATEITIELEGRPDSLRLSVSDNGSGLPHEAVGTTRGLGLRTMRARAAALGGTLALDGSPSGTTVRVAVPRHDPADD